MAAADPNLYKWKFNYRARQFFNDINVPRAALTNDQIDAYVTQLDLVDQDANLAIRTVYDKINGLKTALNVPGNIRRFPAVPQAIGTNADLNAIYPAANMPTAAQIQASRARIRQAPAVPAVQPQAPGAPQAPSRPIGIAEPQPVVNPVVINNIVLAANPPSLYEAIQDADVPALTREIRDPDFDPNQTFSVTITPDGGANPIVTPLTPLQYAALKGVKGIVRFLLNNTKSNISKQINGNRLSSAVTTYRMNDSDKNDIEYIFNIVETAVRDSRDDFTSGISKDTTYGNSLNGEINKKLAKKYYTDEYDSLGAIGPASVTAQQTTPELIRIAKAKAKQDAEASSPKNMNYTPIIARSAYETEYDKVSSEKSSRTTTTSLSGSSTKGKDDGSKGFPIDPDYTAQAVPPKPAGEIESYGKEYDKSFAAYKGEQDGILGEISDISKIADSLSDSYKGANATQTYKDSINKIYEKAYQSNQTNKTDLVKESGYVGTYPVNKAVLSGNYFGFGPELNKILGFDASETNTLEQDSEYHEGFAEFVKNFRTLVGQAKYSGYVDGKSKNAKYTTPGKISVKGKDYSVDFGKLNVQIDKQIVNDSGNIDTNPDYTDVNRILREVKEQVNSTVSLEGLINFIRGEIQNIQSKPIQDALSSVVTSQRGGAGMNRLDLMIKINRMFPDETTKKKLIGELQLGTKTQVDFDKFEEMLDALNTGVATSSTTPLLATSNAAAPAAPTALNAIPVQEARKASIKLKIDKLVGAVKNTLLQRLETPIEDLDQLDQDVNTETASRVASIQTKLNGLPDGTRKTEMTSALTDAISTFQEIDDEVDVAIDVTASLNSIQDNAKKTVFETRFNNLLESLDVIKKDVDKANFDQLKPINEKKLSIKKDISKLTDVVTKSALTLRLNNATINLTDLISIHDDVARELYIQKIKSKISKVPNGTVQTGLTTLVDTPGEDLDKVASAVDVWLNLQKDLKNTIWYIADSVPEKAGFLTQVNNPNITVAELQTLSTDISPFIPSNVASLKQGFGTYIGSPVSQAAQTVGTAASQAASAVGTAASAVGTAASAVGTAASESARMVGTEIDKRTPYLGAVETKSQLYNKITQVLSKFPKYKYVKIDKSKLSGKDPTDPSLPLTKSVTSRLQAIYDKEFQRGMKESMRKAGGTRRRTNKSTRLTKKQRSKK